MLDRINELEKQAKQILQEIGKIKEKEKMVSLDSLKPGETFWLCDKEWIVLEHEGEGTKVISKDLWGTKKFGNSKNYKESTIKDFIEREILPKITEAVGDENIIEHEVDLTALDGGNDFGKVISKLHPIEFMEARKYFPLLVNESLDDWWFTCTPWNSGNNGNNSFILVFSPSGYVYYDIYSCDGGVRPFCILRSSIFVSIK